MTTTDTTTDLTPPAGYPSAEWIEDPLDVFHVGADLRAYYAAQDLPTPQQIRSQLSKDGSIGQERTIAQVITDANGRHVLAPMVQTLTEGQAQRDPFKGWRQPKITLDPLNRDSLAFKTWQHTLRMDAATKMQRSDAAIQQQRALQPRCSICQTILTNGGVVFGPFTRGHLFCGACAHAVDAAGSLRYLAAHQAEIDTWLDAHPPQH